MTFALDYLSLYESTQGTLALIKKRAAGGGGGLRGGLPLSKESKDLCQDQILFQSGAFLQGGFEDAIHNWHTSSQDRQIIELNAQSTKGVTSGRFQSRNKWHRYNDCRMSRSCSLSRNHRENQCLMIKQDNNICLKTMVKSKKQLYTHPYTPSLHYAQAFYKLQCIMVTIS